MSPLKFDVQGSLFESLGSIAAKLFDQKDKYKLFATKVWPVLVRYRQELAECYDPGEERPWIEPVVLLAVLIFQFLERVPDRQASELVKYHLAWKPALNLKLGQSGFHPATFVYFRHWLSKAAKNEVALRAVVAALQEKRSPPANPWGSQRDHTNETNAWAQAEPDSRHSGEGLSTPNETFVVNGKRMSATITPHDLNRILLAEHDDPFAILGLHQVGIQLVLRAFRPEARSLAVLDRQDPSRRFAADRVAKEGFFEAAIGEDTPPFDYLLEVTTWKEETVQFVDPYSFGPILGELDMLLLKEGNHFKIYEKLGAHLVSINGYAGVSFAIWAPKAQRVSVVGDFNGWDGRIHPMRRRMEAGIWEIFVPGVCEGAHYKFEVRNCFGRNVLKSDPFAFYGQHSLKTASLVFDLDRFGWSDQAWMEARDRKQWQREPVSVYEVHLGSWARVPEENNRYLVVAA